MPLPFSRPEMDLILQACGAIRIDDCTPPYLQEFIAQRLASKFPGLSTKVRNLGADEMDRLCEEIKSNQLPTA